MAKSSITPHVDYLQECLDLLKERIDETNNYLKEVKWNSFDSSDEREKEFKFQATLVDKYVTWLNEYSKLSGIVDKIKEIEGEEDIKVRKGSFKSPFAQMIKDDEL